jgi:hypothetical protein
MSVVPFDARARQKMAADFLTVGHQIPTGPQDDKYPWPVRLAIFAGLAVICWGLLIGAFFAVLHALNLLGQLVGAW